MQRDKHGTRKVWTNATTLIITPSSATEAALRAAIALLEAELERRMKGSNP